MFSKKFKKCMPLFILFGLLILNTILKNEDMVELRLPRFSDSGVAGFISYFLNELADKHPALNKEIRLYCLCILLCFFAFFSLSSFSSFTSFFSLFSLLSPILNSLLPFSSPLLYSFFSHNNDLTQPAHQKYLDEGESPVDAPSDSIVGQLRHAIKTYLAKGAALFILFLLFL